MYICNYVCNYSSIYTCTHHCTHPLRHSKSVFVKVVAKLYPLPVHKGVGDSATSEARASLFFASSS